MAAGPPRLRVAPRRNSRRRIEQRLAARFSGVVPRAMWTLARGPLSARPGSRVRKLFLERLLAQTYEIMERRDWAVGLPLFPPSYEMHIAQDGPGPGAGVSDVYRGREGLKQGAEDFVEAFESLRYEPEAAFDLGARVVVLLRMVARGASGVETRQTLGIVYEIEDGRLMRERHYWEWPNALDAAGLPRELAP